MKLAVHLTPGPDAAARAAGAISRRLFAAAGLVAALMALAAALVARDAMTLSSRNRALAARVEAARSELSAAEGDKDWTGTRDRALRLAALLEAGGPAASATLSGIERALPSDVVVRSLRFSRKEGTLAIEGRSPRYEGGEALRAALAPPGSGWKLALEKNGYDQAARVYAFRIAGVRAPR